MQKLIIVSLNILTLIYFLPTVLNTNIYAEQKYRIGKLFANAPDSCIPDKNGPYTRDECLAKLQEGKYNIEDFLYGIQHCVKDPNGPYTHDECLAKLQEGKYNTKDSTIGEICVKDPNGPYTHDECLAKLREGKWDIEKLLGQKICVRKTDGKYTFEECQEALKNPPSPSPGGGQNPCVGGKCETAIGNIPTDIQGFAGRILQIAIGLAGGLALILMVIGSVRVLTSSGDQQRLAAGRDMIVAAVAGLLFLIFSVLILRFIGVNIVGL